MANATVSYLWRDRKAHQHFRTGISLHSHTNQSRETLDFLANLGGNYAMIRPFLACLEHRAEKRHGIRVNYCSSYWTPPMTPKLAFELESEQIERLGLDAMVSITDHDNIAAPMFEHTQLPKSQIYELSELKIALVGLPSNAGDLKPSELSGGMRKRAGLARALALDPELLFLDEPTSGLDPIGAAAFDELIHDLSTSLGLTVFMITHDLDSLYAITDRVAVLADQKIVAVSPVRELEHSDHPWIKEYFLGPRGRAVVARESLHDQNSAKVDV